MPHQAAPKESVMRIVGICAVFLLAVISIPSALIALFLLVEARSWRGRVFAIVWILMFALICRLYRSLRQHEALSKRTAGLWLIVFAGFAGCCLVSPPGVVPAGSKLQSVFPRGRPIYMRLTPPNLVPEIDQATMGADLASWADPLMTRAKAVRMKALFLTKYREMQNDPEFVAAGSVMGSAYADVFGLPFKDGHLFSYVPAHQPGGRLPVILFLHGSCGNFKAYIWTWKRFADAHQVAIVAPTFGFGNWDNAGGLDANDSAYDYCRHTPELDADRVILAGLSNGAIGVSREACRNPGRYRGLIYISAVMEPDVMSSTAFQQGCKDKPVLVLHGDQDERIPRKFVELPLRGLPARVTAKFYPDEDHFLFFSKSAEVMEDIFDWANWTSIGGATADSWGNVQFTDPPTNTTQRFYRLYIP